jgi:hypothetical protein
MAAEGAVGREAFQAAEAGVAEATVAVVAAEADTPVVVTAGIGNPGLSPKNDFFPQARGAAPSSSSLLFMLRAFSAWTKDDHHPSPTAAKHSFLIHKFEVNAPYAETNCDELF